MTTKTGSRALYLERREVFKILSGIYNMQNTMVRGEDGQLGKKIKNRSWGKKIRGKKKGGKLRN